MWYNKCMETVGALPPDNSEWENLVTDKLSGLFSEEVLVERACGYLPDERGLAEALGELSFAQIEEAYDNQVIAEIEEDEAASPVPCEIREHPELPHDELSNGLSAEELAAWDEITTNYQSGSTRRGVIPQHDMDTHGGGIVDVPHILLEMARLD